MRLSARENNELPVICLLIAFRAQLAKAQLSNYTLFKFKQDFHALKHLK